MKKCAKCGEICGDSSKFCSNCGASLADAEIVTDDITGQVGEALEHALDQMIPPLEEEARIAKEKEAEEKKPETENVFGQKAKENQAEQPSAEKDADGKAPRSADQRQAADKKTEQPDLAAAGLGMAASAAAGAGMAVSGAVGPEGGQIVSQTPAGGSGRRADARQEAAAGQPAAGGMPQQGRRPARPQRGAGAQQQMSGNGRPRMPQGQMPGNGQTAGAGARGGQNGAGQQPIGTIVRRTQGMPGQPGRPMTPVRPNPTVQTIRNTARGLIRSPFFILFTLAGFASIALGIARQFLETINLSDVVTVLKNFGASEQIQKYANQGVDTVQQLGKFSIIPVIVGYLPDLLILLGAVILIVSASKKKEEMSSSGFTMIKIGLIINMVVVCLIIFAGLVAATALTVTAWISKDRVYFVIALVILILAVIISMMIIMYYFSLLHTRKAVMRNAVNGEDYSIVSGYAAVICIISAVLFVLPLMYEIVNNQTYGTATIGCTILVRLFIGIWILYYRGKMEKVIGE